MIKIAIFLLILGCEKSSEKIVCEKSSGEIGKKFGCSKPGEKSKPESEWEVITLKDKFGDPTSVKALQTSVNGSFSNSATTASSLRAVVRFAFDPDFEVSFILWEYDSIKATACCSEVNYYSIVVRQDNGDKKSFSGSATVHSSFIYVKDTDGFIDALLEADKSAKISIVDESTSSYLFTVSTVGLKDQIKEFKGG